MNDICTYTICLCGQMDASEFNAMSPLEVGVERIDAASIQLTVRTDQSGLVGLIRHLHGLGFVFLSMNRVDMS